MKLDLKEWEQLHARLARMWAEGELSAALSRGAEHLANEVRSHLPSGSDVTVTAEVDGMQAVVGSMAASAVGMELGTATAAPMVFLAPAAAAAGEAVAQTVAAAIHGSDDPASSVAAPAAPLAPAAVSAAAAVVQTVAADIHGSVDPAPAAPSVVAAVAQTVTAVIHDSEVPKPAT